MATSSKKTLVSDVAFKYVIVEQKFGYCRKLLDFFIGSALHSFPYLPKQPVVRQKMPTLF